MHQAKKLFLAAAAGIMTIAMTASSVAADSLPTLGSLKPTEGMTLATDAGKLGRQVITLMIVVGAILALYYLIMGAIGWITSDGDKGKVEEARNRMIGAVVGLLILASVWAIFQLVLTIGFGGTNLKVVQLGGS